MDHSCFLDDNIIHGFYYLWMLTGVYMANMVPIRVTYIGIVAKLCNSGNYSLSSEITVGNCKKMEHPFPWRDIIIIARLLSQS